MVAAEALLAMPDAMVAPCARLNVPPLALTVRLCVYVIVLIYFS